MKLLRLAAFAAVASLAACTLSPTNSASTDAASPSFDGGGGIGSGNYLNDDVSSGGTTVPADTTNNQRGGNMIGSGN